MGPGDITYSIDTYVPVADNYLSMTTDGTIANSVRTRGFTWLWAITATNRYGVWPYEYDVSVVEYTNHTYYMAHHKRR